ncbi:MAG TPA: dephospho-CoA kinase [Burkholderiales bacterium]|nr:dephospho-CoA kinase [Burkholderiales bacterium]
MPFTVGLTGGIGCGKSSAAQMFADRGVRVVDTDAISHRLTAPGGPALAAIRRHFGNSVFTSDGSLDRAQLRKRVFSDPRAKKKLEALLHPLIRAKALQQLARCTTPYSVLVVPLLLETGEWRKLVQQVLVVDCNEKQQIVRAMSRSRLSNAEVRAIMATQLTRAARLKLADDVLSNTSSLEELQKQVNTLHRKYLRLSQRDTTRAS